MVKGKCPNCGKDVEYYEYDVNETSELIRNWSCEDCEITGKEIYNLKFKESMVDYL